MIIKIKSSKKPTFKKLLSYMMHDKDRLLDKTGKSFFITHNIKGFSIDAWDAQFKKNELNRIRKRSNSTVYTHEIISFHRDDSSQLDLEKMETITREYIQLRNPNGMFIAVPHFDKTHFHIHLCVSGIQKSGMAMRMSRMELQQLKKDMQTFQIEKYPELSKSLVKHGRKEKSLVTDQEFQYKLRTGRETTKETIGAILKTCFKKANSKDSFYSLVSESGLETYERSNKVTGIKFNNQKFRFSKLGFTEERLTYLQRNKQRSKELNNVRKKEVLHEKKLGRA